MCHVRSKALTAILLLLSVLLGTFVLPTQVLADSTVITASIDAVVDSGNPDTNYNSDTGNIGNALSGGYLFRAFANFDISGLPAGVTITSAILAVYYHSYPFYDPVGYTVLAQRLVRTNWVETECTWHVYKSGSYWSNEGASNALYDYSITNQASATVPASPGWIQWDITAQVQWAQSQSKPVAVKFRFDNEASPGYEIRCWWSEEPGYEPKLTITYYPATIPAVTTGIADSTTSTGAVCHGTITSTGGATVTRRGIKYGLTQTDTWDSYQTGSFGVGDFSRTLSGLIPNTTYWYRAYATSSAGTGYGSWSSFTTTSTSPSVTTSTSSSVGGDSAVLSGTITSTGGSAVTSRGFKYGLTQTDTWSAYEVGTFNTGAYALTISGLVPDTRYWYRAFATNGMGTSYGSWVYFTTVGLPTVTTNDATYVGSTSARLNGHLSYDGGEPCEYRFQYGYASGVYDFETSWTGNATTGSSLYADVSSLVSDTSYYFRVQVRNSAGVVSGSEKSFTTAWELLPPTDFSARATSGSEISLLWVKGGGSDRTLIRMKTGSYPTTLDEGTQVYFGQSSSVAVGGLSAGITYYFSAWGESSGDYSSEYTQAMTTTLAGSPVGEPTDPNEPSGWFQIPSTARITGMPLYPQVNALFDVWGLPRETGWVGLALLISALMGVLALSYFPKDPTGVTSNGAVYAALVASAFVIVVAKWMGILPFFLMVPILIIEGGYAFVRSRT